jgi:hypothetical protein
VTVAGDERGNTGVLTLVDKIANPRMHARESFW